MATSIRSSDHIAWLGLVLVAGCYLSHGEVPGSDGGVASDAREDGEVGSECGFLGPYRRCDVCDVPCPAPTECYPRTGVCRPPDRASPGGFPIHDTCVLRFEPVPYGDRLDIVDYYRAFGSVDGCEDAALCAVGREDGPTLEQPFTGVCMDPDYCEALATVPETELVCRGTDGRVVARAPAPEACPPGLGFCGEGCDPCPDHMVCAGVSETRAVGVCASAIPCFHPDQTPVDETRIHRDYLVLNGALRECREYAMTETCLCLTFEPWAWPEYPEQGVGVPLDACHAYAARYPGETVCHEEWEH